MSNPMLSSSSALNTSPSSGKERSQTSKTVDVLKSMKVGDKGIVRVNGIDRELFCVERLDDGNKTTFRYRLMAYGIEIAELQAVRTNSNWTFKGL